MWKEDKGFTGVIKYDFFRGKESCDFCKLHKETNPCIELYCRGPESCGLITIMKSKDSLYMGLYSAVPRDNDFRELEIIGINLSEKEGHITKEFSSCDYDPHLSLVLPVEDVKNIIESILVLEEGGIPSEEILGIKLNIFKGRESEWIEAYQKKFDEIRTMLKEKAETVPPLFESPMKDVFFAVTGQSYEDIK